VRGLCRCLRGGTLVFVVESAESVGEGGSGRT
jgi:hypothetical protein